MSTLRLLPSSSGSPIEITKEQTVMGRDPACDMVVADGSISRRHARIEKRGSGWAVVDQGSANGTFVDSQRTAESELHNGQELRLGAIAFKVEIEGEAEELGATIASLPSETLLQAAVVAPLPLPPPRPVAPPPPPPPAPPRPAPPRAAAPPPPPPPARPSAPPRPGAAASPVRSMGAPAPAKKGKGPLFWILTGCCGCLLLVLLGLGGFVGLLYMNTQPPATAVRAMLKDAKGNQLDQAYLRCSEGYRARVSREEFEALIASHPALRQNADATFMNRSNSNGVVTFKDATLVADDKEQESVTFRVVQEGGEWKIDDIVAAGPGSPTASTSQPGTAPSAPEAPAGSLTLMAGEVRKTRDGDAVKVEISVIASGIETRGGDADMVEDVETHGPDGRRIPNLSKDGIEHFTGALAAGQHTFETTLTVNSNNPPGTYRVLLTVHDKLSGSESSQEVTFELP